MPTCYHAIIISTAIVVSGGCRFLRDLTRTRNFDLRDHAQAVLVGAGDIAVCESQPDNATGQLVADIVSHYQGKQVPVVVFTAGDNAYPTGDRLDFKFCYDSAWGIVKHITRPAPGNHEYLTKEASAYFEYFGDLAGPSGQGYYRYELAGWDIFALNSEVLHTPSSPAAANLYRRISSEQLAWLDKELRAPIGRCSLAYWHHPRFNSGSYGDDPAVATLWDRLYASGTEVIVTGHEHVYERFKPLRPDRSVDQNYGSIQFVVGTGGASLRAFPRWATSESSEKRISDKYGVLVLALEADTVFWRFVATTRRTEDHGSVVCHEAPTK